MQQYSLVVALRFWHPTIDPSSITEQLGISPMHFNVVGQPRFTPKGTPLEGTYKESYWHAEPIRQGWCESAISVAEDTLRELLPQLLPHRHYIQHIADSGGRAMIHISTQSSSNYAIVLSPELMAEYSNLGLSIAHEVYSSSFSRQS